MNTKTKTTKKEPTKEKGYSLNDLKNLKKFFLGEETSVRFKKKSFSMKELEELREILSISIVQQLQLAIEEEETIEVEEESKEEEIEETSLEEEIMEDIITSIKENINNVQLLINHKEEYLQFSSKAFNFLEELEESINKGVNPLDFIQQYEEKEAINFELPNEGVNPLADDTLRQENLELLRAIGTANGETYDAVCHIVDKVDYVYRKLGGEMV